MVSYSLAPIGYVESPAVEPLDAAWGSVVSRVVLFPEYRPGLRGLEAFSHAIVVTWLHGAAFDAGRHLVRRPQGLATMPKVGIFAQRAKDRPNPIGITAVRIVEVAADAVVVRGLDAIDSTPLLDLKPYLPHFDLVESVIVPPWANELMEGYF